MKAKSRQSGLTLTEMVVVIATIALLVGLGVPAVRAFLNSFESQSGARSMISAALASARAVAAKEQRYAGVRFQKAYQPAGLLKARQYMIFIVHDPDPEPNGTDLANGFRAVEGLKPIKLPDSVGVMDFKYRPDSFPPSGDGTLDDDSEISNLNVFRDTTAFSIIFSPSGKMVIHDVRVRNRDGRRDISSPRSYDDVFNKKADVEAGIGMFYQDDYYPVYAATDNLGLGLEPSRRSFIIYEKEKFRRAYEKGRAWSDYLRKLVPEMIYINPYTGTIISAD